VYGFLIPVGRCTQAELDKGYGIFGVRGHKGRAGKEEVKRNLKVLAGPFGDGFLCEVRGRMPPFIPK
jgi:hypothetical protein